MGPREQHNNTNMSQSMANDELERVVDFIEKMTQDGTGLGDPAERMPWLAVTEDYDYTNNGGSPTTSTSTSTSASAGAAPTFTKAEVRNDTKGQRKSLLSQAREDQKATPTKENGEKKKGDVGAQKEAPAKGRKKVQMRVAEQKPKPQEKAKSDEVKRNADEAGDVVSNLKAELGSGPAEDQKKSWLGLF